MKKKITAWMLTIMVAVTFVPMISFGAENENATKIYTIEDLYAINNNLSGSYVLMNDLDMSPTRGGDWDSEGKGWVGIGTSKNPFTGEFDGNGHVISNLYVKRGTIGGAYSLFNYSSGYIHNLKVKDFYLNASYVGGICSELSSGAQISNCASEDCTIEGAYQAGGIAGEIQGAATISKCYNTSSRRLTTHGFDLNATQDRKLGSGGIVGSVKITKSESATISNCYNTGDSTVIYGHNGGILGFGDGKVSINKCYSICTLTDTEQPNAFLEWQNPIAGYATASDATKPVKSDCYSNAETSLARLKLQSTYTNWDFDNTWIIDENVKYEYPQLRPNRQDTAKIIDAIEWKTLPDKKTYYQGEPLDVSGGVLNLYYSDNHTETLTVTEKMVSGYDMDKLGPQTLTVKHKGLKVTFEITVKSIASISQVSNPDKTEFVRGTSFDLTGWVIRIIYTDGTTEDINITESMVTGGDINSSGTYTLAFTINNQTFTQDVTVIPVKLTSIKVTTLPDTLEFIEGQTFNADGMEVTAYYNNGDSSVITDYEVSGYSSEIGTHTITVTYMELSDSFTVDVIEGTPIALSVTTLPGKTRYIEGESFDPTGMVVEAVYPHNITKTVTDYSCSSLDNTIGKQNITVTYKNVSTTISVTVVEKTLLSIQIKQPPEKTTYIQKESFDPEGLIVTATYDNGKVEELSPSDYKISGFSTTSLGEKEIIISYSGFTTSFMITVIAPTLIKLNVTEPEKTEYLLGEELDLTGLEVFAQYDNGVNEKVTDFEVTGFNNTAGVNVITITYKTKEYSFTVLVHNPSGEWLIVNEPSCTKEGKKVQLCTECNEVVIEESIPVKEHSYGDWEITKEATCTVDGSRERACIDCGEVEKETISAEGHDWNQKYVTDSEATCTVDGVESQHCNKCGAKTNERVIPALGHAFGDWVTVKNSTCEESGLQQRTCERCEYVESRDLEPNNHDWEETITIDKKATCAEDGSQSRHCKNCDAKMDVETIPAFGHSYDETIHDSTCTENGTIIKECSVCGNIVSTVIEAKGHDLIHYDAIPATCEQSGREAYDICSRCDYQTSHNEIPALGHNWKHIILKAGLLKNGREYDTCTTCGLIKNNKTLIGYAAYYVKSLKVTKGKKSFTVKWTKQSAANQKKFNGYQIRYSLKSNMAGAKYATAAKSSKSKKISKLLKKKKYYVQVRTYTVKGGKTFYSKWSPKKSVKTK